MQVELETQELDVLRRVVEQRLDGLLGQLSAADSLSFKESLREEHDLLAQVYDKLGCERPERSTARSCAVGAEDTGDLEGLRPEEVG